MRINPDDCRDPDLLAAEVRRLKAVIAAGEPTLTDAEREAIEWCIEMATIHATECDEELAALRKLLERLK